MAAAWRRLGVDAHIVEPATAREELRPGDVAVVRLGVRPTVKPAAAILAARKSE